jgi:hypothetical protein
MVTTNMPIRGGNDLIKEQVHITGLKAVSVAERKKHQRVSTTGYVVADVTVSIPANRHWSFVHSA